jgi:hypothetical protein
MMIPLPYLAMCPESRLLAVAGASDCQVLVYKFRKYSRRRLYLKFLSFGTLTMGEHASGGGFDFSKVGDTKTNLEYFVPIRTKTDHRRKFQVTKLRLFASLHGRASSRQYFSTQLFLWDVSLWCGL